MNNQQLFAALSQDLLRVALGFHNGSVRMAERFREEVIKREAELDKIKLSVYKQNIIFSMVKALKNEDEKAVAEHALMYSGILQNYALQEE